MSSKKGKPQPAGVGMTPSKTEFGNFIRTRRLELGITQVALAKQVGFKQTSMSLIEVGERSRLNDRQLERLAKALQCNVEELRKRMPAIQIAVPKTELGKLIFSRREKLGLSRLALAEKAKVTYMCLYRLEMNSKSLSMHYSTALKLATALALDASLLGNFIGKHKKEPVSEFGKLIRTRRRALGMVGSRLADELNVSIQYIDQIESGDCRLSNSDELIARLAKILQIDVDKLNALRPAKRAPELEHKTPLGRLLVTRRFELCLSQKEAAKRAGISSVVLGRMEAGKYKLLNGTAKKLAKALEFEIPAELIEERKKWTRR